MKVAIVVVQLKLTHGATADGIKLDVAHALSLRAHVEGWPEGHFYFVGSALGADASKVKRARIIDLPEDS